MRKLIQPRAAQGAGSVSVYHDWKAVTYHYANMYIYIYMQFEEAHQALPLYTIDEISNKCTFYHRNVQIQFKILCGIFRLHDVLCPAFLVGLWGHDVWDICHPSPVGCLAGFLVWPIFPCCLSSESLAISSISVAYFISVKIPRRFIRTLIFISLVRSCLVCVLALWFALSFLALLVVSRHIVLV